MSFVIPSGAALHCSGADQYITVAWIVSGDPAGTIQVWRTIGGIGELIHQSSTLVGGIQDQFAVSVPPVNVYYRIRATNSDGVYVDDFTPTLSYEGHCII